MLRPIAALTLLLPAAFAAQTAPNDPQTPPESFSTTPAVPTTTATEPAYTAQPAFATEPAPIINVDRIVVLGFPGHDTDGVPGLSITEFGGWVGELFVNAGQPQPTGDYVTAAFTQSDVDGDGLVSTGEFAAFLKGA